MEGMKSQYGSNVTVRVCGERSALVRFDRGANRNAINQDVLLSLTEVAHDLVESSTIHTVILAGSERIFSAGIDLKDPEKWQDDEADLLSRRRVAQRGARLCRLWEDLPQITIAAMEGPVVGGAVALALACDFRVAASDTFFYLPESKVGLNMGWGAIPRMVALLGPSRTKLAILTAERIHAEQALEAGLVDRVSTPGEAFATAESLAASMSVSSGAIIRMTKESVNACATLFHRIGSYMDADQALVCRDSPEGREARNRFLGERGPAPSPESGGA